MSNAKDYYQILGITPSAELAVIKAVYKALALKYHPDRNKGNLAAAAKQMAEINEAYSVLSEEQKRAAYDQSRRGSSEQEQFDQNEDFSRQFSDVEQQIEADWSLAKKYYPDLDSILSSLAVISKSLVMPYKLTLLEKNKFDDRQKIADGMIDDYLQTYFGKNPDIVSFARSLLLGSHRDAAHELNKAVKLFGKDIDEKLVRREISKKFNVCLERDGEKTLKDCRDTENQYSLKQFKKINESQDAGYLINIKLFIAALILSFFIQLLTVEFQYSFIELDETFFMAIGFFVYTYLIAAIPLIFFNKNNSDGSIIAWSFVLLVIIMISGSIALNEISGL